MGKTFSSMTLFRKYVMGNLAIGLFPRQVLIFDVNDEYDEFQVRAIHLRDTAMFSIQRKFEIRRIRPFMDQDTYNLLFPQDKDKLKIPKGQWIRMNTEQQLAMLGFLLENFKYGLLLIEDINKNVGDSMSQDLTGTICTNRHANCDIMIHYQSAGRPLPKIWDNADEVRFHYQTSSVDKNKLKDSYEIFKIAQIMVNVQFEKGDIRFHAWINKITNKIIGNFTKDMFLYAIKEYLATHPKELSSLLIRRDEVGKKVYSYPQAENIMTIKLFNKYWGN